MTFINEGDETTPDLRVQDIAYVECKDIQSTNKENTDKPLADNLGKASQQLAAAQLRQRLPGTGVCMSVPEQMLPLEAPAFNVVREVLSAADGPQFALFVSSEVNYTKEAVSYPHKVCLVWSESGRALFEPILRHLTPSSFLMQPHDFERFDH